MVDYTADSLVWGSLRLAPIITAIVASYTINLRLTTNLSYYIK